MAISRNFRWGLVLILLSSCEDSDSSVEKNGDRTFSSGKELYLQHCAACHGEKGDLGSSGAKNLQTTHLTPSQIKKIIRDGKNAMPSFREILGSHKNLDSIAHYVLTLKK